ncbi:MAG: 1-acyl-sn-glycerol-3-phosphate acyltransferase [Bacteroides sp.]|nr:1-acyl-sn-glycerol-3-phosphate acyltransferase [Bacteroides sp.]
MSKKKNKKIQDYDRTYSFLHHFVRFAVNHSYRKILHVGKENIPQDGAVIFAPNHTNTLMDALVILTYNHNPKVFVARADIFRNRKLAKILTFLKIMPIMRQRDGFQAVKKNQETIDKAVDVLKDKIPFCIFPEGTHQAKYSSLPLSKGILKIAFQAHEQMPEIPLYIVPVGIRYGDFFRFRSTVRMEFGQPINVNEYIEANKQHTPQEQMNSMRELLAERLHATIFHIPNDEDYNATYEICNAAEPIEIEKLQKEKANREMHKLELQFQANNHTLKRIEVLKNSEPEKAKKMLALGHEANSLRKAKGIDIESVSVKRPLVSRITRILLTLITLPYTLLASVLASPTSLICVYIFTKLKDPAFKNSVRFVINLLVWPLLVIAYSIVAFFLLPWQWALPIALLIIPSPIVAHELWKTMRLTISDIKYLREKKLKNIYSLINIITQ